MKTIILILLMTLTLSSAYSQSYKFRATAFTVQTKPSNSDTWGKWGDWKEVSVLIIHNLDDRTIKIFSEKEQTYYVTYTGEKLFDSEGNPYRFIDVIDQDDIPCTIKLLWLSPDENDLNAHFYIIYPNITWVYQCYMLL